MHRHRRLTSGFTFGRTSEGGFIGALLGTFAPSAYAALWWVARHPRLVHCDIAVESPNSSLCMGLRGACFGRLHYSTSLGCLWRLLKLWACGATADTGSRHRRAPPRAAKDVAAPQGFNEGVERATEGGGRGDEIFVA